MYDALEDKDENIIYSPLSISIGLGMLLEGAKSAIKNEIINFFAFSSKREDGKSISDFFKQVKIYVLKINFIE